MYPSISVLILISISILIVLYFPLDIGMRRSIIAAVASTSLAASPLVPVPTLPVGSEGEGSSACASIVENIVGGRGSEEHNRLRTEKKRILVVKCIIRRPIDH